MPSSTATSTRRALLRRGIGLAAVLAAGSSTPSQVLASTSAGDGPFGPLGRPDHNGIRLPAGFTSRMIARTADRVGPSSYRWHEQPDGGDTFATPDRGHVYVSNSEIGNGRGGASAIRFDRSGAVVDAYAVLSGSSRNCSGGRTPWGTWLSCEENGADGQVWECDPVGTPVNARRLPALGSFNHEAVEVVARARTLFMTEDTVDGRLYKFTPNRWPDLSSGRLQAANVEAGGGVRWIDVDDHAPERSSRTTPFSGPEGLAAWRDTVFMATKRDKRLWRYDLRRDVIEILHDCQAHPESALSSVDNLFVDHTTGRLYVAEDQDEHQQLCVVSLDDDGGAQIAPVLEFVDHGGSEVTGPSLSPSGSTMYVSSQRGTDGRGLTFAIDGPWHSGVSTGPLATGIFRRAQRIRNS